MVTPKQLEANRLNARKSTGPRSAAGKAVSSQNALKTGLRAASLIIRGESREEFDALADSFYRQYQPETPQYQLLVDDLIRNSWFLQRYDRIEGEFWNCAPGSAEEPQTLCATLADRSQFYKCLRGWVTTAERNIRVLIDQLQKPALNQPPEFVLPNVVELTEPVACSQEPPVVPAPAVEPAPEPAPVAETAVESSPASADPAAQPSENGGSIIRNGFVRNMSLEAFVREAHEHLLFNQRPLREEDLDKIPADRLPADLKEAC